MTIIHERRREPDAVLESAEATVAYGAQWGYSYRVAQGRVLRGWALAALGQVEEGIEELVCGLEASRATGARMEDPYYLGLLADAYLRAGEIEPGLSAVAEALEAASRERSQFHEAELHRLRAALLLAADGADRAAEASLQEALAIARRQGSPALELRAALSLGGLLRERGRSAEARSLVASALDHFREGFDTADLQDASGFLARSGRAAAAPPPPPRSRRDAPIRYARSGDLNIAYQVTGDGPVDLVLVPGFVSHLERDWDEPRHAGFLDRLGQLARLIRFDKRGTGLSDRPSDLPDLEARMDDVRAVMDAAGSRRAVLLGYSEGGPMSILFASTYPQRTRALVLFGAFAARVRSPDYPWAPTEAEREASARRVESDWGLEEVMRDMCPSADEAMARWWGRRGRDAASPGAAKALIRMNTRIDVRAVLPAVRVPTLVLHRRGDREVTVEEGRYLAATIPGAQFVELSGIDHFVAIDPDQIVDEIEPFLAGLGEPETEAPAVASVVAVDAERAPDVPAELFGDMRWTRDAILGEVARRYAGELLRAPGHGALLIFDGPARAIRAGLDLVARFADVGLSGRAAVHSGPVARDGERGEGDAGSVAERLVGLAGPDEVLVTGATRSLAEGSELRFDRREEATPDAPELYVVRPPAPAPTPRVASGGAATL